MRKWILFMAAALPGLLSFSASAVTDCSVHRIYCSIIKVNRQVDRKFAMRLSNALYRYGAGRVSVAIAMQESGLRNIKKVTHEFVGGRVAIDYGVFQINHRTARHYGMDIARLQTDLAYQVRQHLRLLRSKVRVCKAKGWAKGEEYSCYHSFTKRHRRKYARSVQRWL